MEVQLQVLKDLLKKERNNETDFNAMHPKNARPAKTHGLPKTRKHYHMLPQFRLPEDTIDIVHYSVKK